MTPDAFRSAAFLSIPTGFQRRNVTVTVASDSTCIDYSYIDEETPLALGLRSQATKIDGYCTAALQSPLAGMAGAALLRGVAFAAIGGQAAVDKLLEAAGGLSGATQAQIRSMPTPDAGMHAFAMAPASMGGAGMGLMGLPKVAGTGVITVEGPRNASKAALAMLGVLCLMDRFTGDNFDAYFNNGTPRIGTISVTQSLTERWVRVEASFIPTFAAQIRAAANMATAAVNTMNMSPAIQAKGMAGTDNIMSGFIEGQNPAPPNSNGTRGDWLGALVTALLATPGQPPALPNDPVPNVDLGSMI